MISQEKFASWDIPKNVVCSTLLMLLLNISLKISLVYYFLFSVKGDKIC